MPKRPNKQNQNRSRGILFAAAALVVTFVFGLESIGYGDAINSRLQDRLIERQSVVDDVVIVAIDDKSIQEFGVWPWPRSIHAEMIEKLTAYEAAVIGYDVTFAETSSPEEDAALLAAIEKSEVLILAAEAHVEDENGEAVASKTLWPREEFRSAALSTGITSLITEPDGVVRRSSRRLFVDNESKPGFTSQIVSFFKKGVTDGMEGTEQLYRIDFVGPPESYPIYSFAEVLSGKVGQNVFNEKIVLVGATAPDLHDTHLTPFGAGELMSGVEVQANFIQSFMKGSFLRTLSSLETIALYLFLAFLFVIIASFLRLRYVLIVTGGLTAVYIIAALGFASSGILLPVVGAASVLVLITIVDILYRYVHEKRQKGWIREAFGRYLAPQVIQKLIDGETELKLGGEKKELSILFSDIRGFTSLSEKLTPEELVTLLNEYLTEMTDIVLDSQGVLDKFIGDAIMAFWGAPLTQDDHAVRAAESALKMRDRLGELQKKWEKEGRPIINIGVGINTGEVIVGNMGSEQRFDYTVIGDDVNLASRLEGLTKQYGVMIIVSESTKKRLGDKFVMRPIDLVAVKGKKKPVWIFELMDRAGSDSEELAKEFGKAVDFYQDRKWDEAEKHFESLVNKFEDKPSEFYVERCGEMRKNPPGKDWDGVFVAKTK